MYMKSNPNYDKVEEKKEPEPKVDVHAELKQAFYLLAQTQVLNAQAQAHTSVQHLSVPSFSGDKSSWEKQAQAWANHFANVVMNAEGNFHGQSYSAVHSQIQNDF